MRKALAEFLRALADLGGNPNAFIVVNLGDADVEVDFVCEGDVERRSACACYVPRDARPRECAKQESDVFLRKRGSPAEGPELWCVEVCGHVAKCKQPTKSEPLSRRGKSVRGAQTRGWMWGLGGLPHAEADGP